MNNNVKSLIEACKDINTSYSVLHKDGNLIQITVNRRSHVFCNWSTPINSQALARLCEDKEYSYRALSAHIDMPRTESFLDPNVAEKYERYRRNNSVEDICEEVANGFEFPVIIKRNRGSHGSNVFRANTVEEVAAAVRTIFDHNSKDYDYVLLAQESIDIAAEYRAVFFNGKLQFAYLKSTEGATFLGNLSPLHWEGSEAVDITDVELLDTIESFVLPGLEHVGMNYAGVDVAMDNNGRLWCIELNSSPGFDRFIEHCGNAKVVGLYKNIIEWLSEES